ncbi:MAG: hypothetical protein ACERKO_06325 [Acetanaerobacterium sp.]
MHSKIRQYIERAFADVPQSAKTDEIKESLYGDLTEKYDDLIEHEQLPEGAYAEVIAGVGDLGELRRALLGEAQEQYAQTEHDRRRTVLLVVGAAVYILSPIGFLLLEPYGDLPAISELLITVAFATGSVINYHNTTKLRWKKERDKNPDDTETWPPLRIRRLYNALAGALWVLAVALFLLYSFITGLWGVSWLVFLDAVVLQLVMKALIISRYGK